MVPASPERGRGSGPRPASRPFAGEIGVADIHVMSWNIRRRTRYALGRTADRWDVRAPRIKSLLQSERPSLLGLQEALPSQVDFVLSALGSAYRSVGYGRSRRGRGERCPIIFDAQRLELLCWEQRALSARPDSPGSISWGNLLPRILVQASFRDRRTGHCVQMVNTHLDHLSSGSRRRSVHCIGQLVAQSPVPVLVTGDFNAGLDAAEMQELSRTYALLDASGRARSSLGAAWGTLGSYRVPRTEGRKLDWILVSPGILVTAAGVNGLRYHGGWGSDHLPVQAVLRLPEQERWND